MPSNRKSKVSKAKRHNSKKTKHNQRSKAQSGDTNQRALALLSDLRRGVGTYSELLGKHRLRGRTAREILGRDLIGDTRGKRVRASKSDRRVRDLMFPESFGDVRIRTRNSKDATKLANYYDDREKLLRGKLRANAFETKWRGVTVAKRDVFADADRILHMAEADVFRMESLYATMGTEK